ncbi:MAG: type ISP restriction/modification enzyme, partial [Terriglobales bacterium]
FQSHRDGFAVAFDRQEIERRVDAMRNPAVSDAQLRQHFELEDNRDWQLERAREQMRAVPDPYAPVVECLYRPLDRRWCYYDAAAMDRPRREILEHVAGRANLCLNTVRQTRKQAWRHALASDCPAAAVYVELKDGSNLFPLYLYDGRANGHLFYENGREIADVNFAPAFLQAAASALGLKFHRGSSKPPARSFTAEQLFAYIYAVLNTPSFAARYGEHLRRGWPRVPLTSDVTLFRKLGRLGERLIACHLLREVEFGASFPATGDRKVRRAAFEDRRVWINEQQYFAGVAPEIWGAELGGYAPAQQWLKDRLGAVLDFDAVNGYRRIIGALQASLRLELALDAAIPRWPLP